MTVAPAVTETVYTLAGAFLGPFATVFPYDDGADVQAWLSLNDGAGARQLGAGSDWTLTDLIPLSTGGNATLNADLLVGGAWPSGARLALVRATPQQSDFDPPELGPFSPAAAAAAIDNLERQIQELKSTLLRSVSLPIGDTGAGGLPPAAARAGNLLGFAASTGALALYPPGGGGGGGADANWIAPTGAAGDGVTDDTAALAAWLALAGPSASSLVLPPGEYLISGPLVLHNTSTNPPVSVYFGGTLVAAPTMPDAPMLKTTGANMNLYNLSLDGGRNGLGGNYATKGFQNNAAQMLIVRPYIQHCSTWQMNIEDGSGVRVVEPYLRQFAGSDPEINRQSTLTAIGIRINTADGMLHGGDAHICKYPVYIAAGCHTFYLHEIHPYGGNGSPNRPAVTAIAHDGVHVTYTVDSFLGYPPLVGDRISITGCSPAGYNASAALVTAVGADTVTIANTTTAAPTVLGVYNIVYVDQRLIYIEPGGSCYIDDSYLDNGIVETFSGPLKIIGGSVVFNETASYFTGNQWLIVHNDQKNHPFQQELDFSPVNMGWPGAMINYVPGPEASVTSITREATAVTAVSGDGTYQTYTVAAWPFGQPTAGDTITTAGFAVGGYNVASAVVVKATATTVMVAGATTGASGLGTVQANVTFNFAVFPYIAAPKTDQTYRTIGFGTGAYNLKSRCTAASGVAGGAGSITLKCSATAATTLGTIAADFEGAYAALSTYTTDTNDMHYRLGGGWFNWWPENNTSHPATEVWAGPLTPISFLFDVAGTVCRMFFNETPGVPGMRFESQFLQVANAVAGGNARISAGANSPQASVAATGAVGDGAHVTYTVASWPNGQPGRNSLIVASGFTAPGFNGSAAVTASTATTVTIASTFAGTTSAGTIGYATDDIGFSSDGDGTGGLRFRGGRLINIEDSQTILPANDGINFGGPSNFWGAAYANFAVESALTGQVASTTHTIAGATKLTAQLNFIATCANAGDAAGLLALTPGQHQDVWNDGAQPAAIYPASAGYTIDGGAAGAPATLTNGKAARFICKAAGVIVSRQFGAPSA